MPNMSYVRFQNTLRDLSECEEALNNGVLDGDQLSDEERRAAERLIALCQSIATDFGDDD